MWVEIRYLTHSLVWSGVIFSCLSGLFAALGLLGVVCVRLPDASLELFVCGCQMFVISHSDFSPSFSCVVGDTKYRLPEKANGGKRGGKKIYRNVCLCVCVCVWLLVCGAVCEDEWNILGMSEILKLLCHVLTGRITSSCCEKRGLHDVVGPSVVCMGKCVWERERERVNEFLSVCVCLYVYMNNFVCMC